MFFREKEEFLKKAISFHGVYGNQITVRLEGEEFDSLPEKWVSIHFINPWENFCLIEDTQYRFKITDYNNHFKKILIIK